MEYSFEISSQGPTIFRKKFGQLFFVSWCNLLRNRMAFWIGHNLITHNSRLLGFNALLKGAFTGAIRTACVRFIVSFDTSRDTNFQHRTPSRSHCELFDISSVHASGCMRFLSWSSGAEKIAGRNAHSLHKYMTSKHSVRASGKNRLHTHACQ